MVSETTAKMVGEMVERRIVRWRGQDDESEKDGCTVIKEMTQVLTLDEKQGRLVMWYGDLYEYTIEMHGTERAYGERRKIPIAWRWQGDIAANQRYHGHVPRKETHSVFS